MTDFSLNLKVERPMPWKKENLVLKIQRSQNEIPINLRASRVFTIFVLASVLTTLGCKKTVSEASKVSVVVAPASPIVIDAAGKFGGGDLSPAWFSFAVKMKNPTTKVVLIRAIKLTVSATTSGGVSSREVTLTPETYSAAAFARLEAGAEGWLNSSYRAGSDSPTTIVYCLDGLTTAPCPYLPGAIGQIYLGGNPGKPQTNNFRYTVTGELIGWFEELPAPTATPLVPPTTPTPSTPQLPGGRFNKTFNFTTE
jgi:hypothetical protein